MSQKAVTSETCLPDFPPTFPSLSEVLQQIKNGNNHSLLCYCLEYERKLELDWNHASSEAGECMSVQLGEGCK